jgi:hypothetical protein
LAYTAELRSKTGLPERGLTESHDRLVRGVLTPATFAQRQVAPGGMVSGILEDKSALNEYLRKECTLTTTVKQAPRAWREKRNEIMAKLGFRAALAESSVYVKGIREEKILVFFYVNDALVASKKIEAAQKTLEEMAKLVGIRMMGKPTRSLGREIKRDRSKRRFKVTQTKFTEELLARFGMAIANPHVMILSDQPEELLHINTTRIHT